MKEFLRKLVVAVALFAALLCGTAFAAEPFTADVNVRLTAELNDFRSQNGLAPLANSETLMADGTVRAEEASRSWSHTRPDGSAWYTVDEALMYGENLYSGATLDGVTAAWIASPAHKANMVSGEFGTVGFGVYYDAVTGLYYIAEEFGL